MGWGTGATMGSFAAGMTILVHYLVTWWPGLKHMQAAPMDAARALLPFVLAYAYGVLVVLGVGGLIGTLADAVVWGVGWVGDGALVYGVGGERQALSVDGRTLALTNGGLMVVLIMTGAFYALRGRSKDLKLTVGRGTLAGVLTGTVPAWSATLAVPLASAVNVFGSWLPGGTA